MRTSGNLALIGYSHPTLQLLGSNNCCFWGHHL